MYLTAPPRPALLDSPTMTASYLLVIFTAGSPSSAGFETSSGAGLASCLPLPMPLRERRDPRSLVPEATTAAVTVQPLTTSSDVSSSWGRVNTIYSSSPGFLCVRNADMNPGSLSWGTEKPVKSTLSLLKNKHDVTSRNPFSLRKTGFLE